jgi:transposase
VHKRQTVVAIADSGREGEVRHYGAVETDRSTIEKLARKLARGGKPVRFCYEAGPCGYGIQRWLTALGHDCEVVAPSLIPRRPGERVHTDRRDAIISIYWISLLAKVRRERDSNPRGSPQTRR